jgi:hypothetical protein
MVFWLVAQKAGLAALVKRGRSNNSFDGFLI